MTIKQFREKYYETRKNNMQPNVVVLADDVYWDIFRQISISWPINEPINNPLRLFGIVIYRKNEVQEWD